MTVFRQTVEACLDLPLFWGLFHGFTGLETGVKVRDSSTEKLYGMVKFVSCRNYSKIV